MTMDLLGWLAAGLMLGTFACRDLVPLRALALAASLAFIGYGAAAGLMPVLVLHLVLLPINAKRLVDALARRRHEAGLRTGAAAGGPAAPDAVMRHPPRDGDDPACVCLAGR